MPATPILFCSGTEELRKSQCRESPWAFWRALGTKLCQSDLQLSDIVVFVSDSILECQNREQEAFDFSTSLTKSASSRVFNSFFIPFAHTPTVVQPVVSRGERCAAILGFLSNLRTRFVSLHRLGVAHQTSLRSPATMMMYSNSPQSGEASSLFS